MMALEAAQEAALLLGWVIITQSAVVVVVQVLHQILDKMVALVAVELAAAEVVHQDKATLAATGQQVLVQVVAAAAVLEQQELLKMVV
jgi:hypothetical protein